MSISNVKECAKGLVEIHEKMEGDVSFYFMTKFRKEMKNFVLFTGILEKFLGCGKQDKKNKKSLFIKRSASFSSMYSWRQSR